MQIYDLDDLGERPELYDVSEAAELFGVGAATLRRYIKEGTVKPTHFKGKRKHPFFSEEDIEEQQMIGQTELAELLGVSATFIKKMVSLKILQPARRTAGGHKHVWFWRLQIPDIKEIVEERMSPKGAAMRLINHVGSAAKALQLLKDRTPSGKYGLWTVIGPPEGVRSKKVLCRCECGATSMVSELRLKHGKSKSCVCCRNKAAHVSVKVTEAQTGEKASQEMKRQTILINDLIRIAGGRPQAIEQMELLMSEPLMDTHGPSLWLQ